MSSFGEELERLRREKGWSLRELGERSGVSHSYIATLEKGYDPRSGAPVRPTVQTVKALAAALGVPAERLYSLLDAETGEKEVSPMDHNDLTERLMRVLEELAASLKERERTEQMRIQESEETRRLHIREVEAVFQRNIERALALVLEAPHTHVSGGRREEAATDERPIAVAAATQGAGRR